jgi:hypothetical protein
VLNGLWQEYFDLLAPQTFPHLLFHSDAEGYYLPLAFQRVIQTPADFGIDGETLGSSLMLLEECRVLAVALDLPLHLDPEGQEIAEAVAGEMPLTERWQRFAIESAVCLALYRACSVSAETGCAVVFG